MLTLEQLAAYFPLPLHRRNPQGVLVEYLQHERLQELDLNFLAGDVEPFLFSSGQKDRILTFRDYWETQKIKWR